MLNSKNLNSILDLEYSIIEEVAKITIQKWLTNCIGKMKKRKELEEKENKWMMLKKRFKSTKIRKITNLNFERSKTLKERTGIVHQNYLNNEISLSDHSVKDETDEETDEETDKENETESGNLLIYF